MRPSRFWIQAGLHDPDILSARFDYAFDPEAAEWLESRCGYVEPRRVDRRQRGGDRGRRGIPAQLHRTRPRTRDPRVGNFYTTEVNGQKLVDWVAALIAGQPLDDVHRAECTAG